MPPFARKLIMCASLAAVSLALAACASTAPVGPDASVTAVPAIAPARTAKVQADLLIDRWWKHFDDATLERLIDEALARNADLESALARVREARASFDVARSAQSPNVDARATKGYEQRSTAGSLPLPPGVDRRMPSHRVSLEAGYEADLWGRLSSTSAAARSQLLATEWARNAVEWSVTAGVAEAYFELVALDRQIAISESILRGRAANVELRRRELAAGVGSEFDLRRAEAELTGTQATLANLVRQRAAFERALQLLVGRTPAQIVTQSLDRATFDEAVSVTAVMPQGQGAEILVRRPDIRQAEAELAAANSSIEAARAATLPSLRLTGSVGSDAKSISDLFSGPAAIWSLAAGVTQPIVDGGRLRARVREEQARGEQALAVYRKTVAAAVAEVREAYASLEATDQAYYAQNGRVQALSRAHGLARRGYDAGALPYIDLLDAERNYYQAQLDHVGARRDQLISQVGAYKALGGGYTPSGSTL